MLRRLAIFVVVLCATGCAFLESQSTITTSTTEPDQGAVATTSTSPTTVVADSACLIGDRPFASEGLISAFGDNNGDATQISGIRWSSYQDCEQVLIEFLTADGAPAGGLDPVGVEYDAAAGVIRVSLPNQVNRSAIADSLLDGEMVRRAFVVAVGDTLAVDIHLAAGRSYAVRAYELDSPARVAIDVKEDSAAPPVLGTTIGPNVVVVSPTPGAVGESLSVSGYVWGPYEVVTAELSSQEDGAVAATGTDTPAPGRTTWREFIIPFDDIPPLQLRLVITPGDQDADTLTIPVDARGST